jgi:hypothetical protein
MAQPSPAIIERMTSTPTSFFGMCKGTLRDGSVDYYTPMPHQAVCLDAGRAHPWIRVGKYRQGGVTAALAIGRMLPSIMYTPGQFGVLIGDTEITSKMIVRRIMTAYRSLPPMVKPGLKREADLFVEFDNGSSILVITAGSKHPGISQSTDYLHLTEECAYEDQATVNSEVMPTIDSRPNALATSESTPGKRGTAQHATWLAAIAAWGLDGLPGKDHPESYSKWYPVFLKWWTDPACSLPTPEGFRMDNEELRFLEKFPFLTTGNIIFRRLKLPEYNYDDLLFRNKFPMGPYDGWTGGSAHPVMPEDAINWLRESASPEPQEDIEWGACIREHPQAGEQYDIFADPAGYGRSGDPSAFMVVKRSNHTEVASIELREDPGLFAHRLMRLGKYYNDALLIVESNAQACIATIRAAGYANIYWTNEAHPGWYATGVGLLAAEGRTVKILREKDLIVRTPETLNQGEAYDGSKRDKRDDEGGHFDRWRCVVMAGDLYLTRLYSIAPTEKPAPRVEESDSWSPEYQKWQDEREERKRKKARNIYVPFSKGSR